MAAGRYPRELAELRALPSGALASPAGAPLLLRPARRRRRLAGAGALRRAPGPERRHHPSDTRLRRQPDGSGALRGVRPHAAHPRAGARHRRARARQRGPPGRLGGRGRGGAQGARGALRRAAQRRRRARARRASRRAHGDAAARGRARDRLRGRARRRRLAPAHHREEPRAAALHRADAHTRRGVRERSGRHRQDLSRDGARDRRAQPPRGLARGAHAARGRSRREARLPARLDGGEGESVPAAPLRRAQRHDADREGRPPDRARRDRGGAARLHARAHAQRLLRDPRRGPEHDQRADEDAAHAPRLRFEGGDHRRRHADRPAERQAQRAGRGDRDPHGGRGHRLHGVHRAGRRAPPAGAVHHPGVRRARPRLGRRREARLRARGPPAPDERPARGARCAQRAAPRRPRAAAPSRAPDPRRARLRATRSSRSCWSTTPRSRRSISAIAAARARPTCSPSRCSRARTRTGAAPCSATS